MAWATHLALAAVVAPAPKPGKCSNYARCINQVSLCNLEDQLNETWTIITLVVGKVRGSDCSWSGHALSGYACDTSDINFVREPSRHSAMATCVLPNNFDPPFTPLALSWLGFAMYILQLKRRESCHNDFGRAT